MIARALVVFAVLFAGIQFMPQALAFPYTRQVRGVEIRSTEPIREAIVAELTRADALDMTSPLAPIPHRRIFLTDGGWRWRLLSLRTHGAFAFTRPLSDAIIVNRSSIDGDSVWNGSPIAGHRTLTGVIAHETTHLMIYRHYGVAALSFPSWKVEGYADHVAQESSLSDADAVRLMAKGVRSPAVRYWHGRQRVEQLLATGITIDDLFGTRG